EPRPTKVKSLKVSADASEMEFEVRWKKEDMQFKLVSEYNVDKVIYRTIDTIPDSGFVFKEDEHDSVELLFNEGALSKVSLFKRIGTEMAGFLDIIKEDGVFIQIRQRPFARVPLTSIVAGDRSIIYRTDSEEFSYSVSVQEYIWD